jgi:hypothetical protein
MNMKPEHVAAIRGYGYTQVESEFLYLVATYSGYFTQRQFLHFARAKKGGRANRFTQKVLRFRHGRTARYGYHTLIYNLYSPLIYSSIDKENLRIRRFLSNDLIRRRLLILDFVLDHLGNQYLETERDKVAYFCDRQNISLPALPGRIYKGIKSNSTSKRYFLDRFPIMISGDPTHSLPLGIPTFVYCDFPDHSLLSYISHLRSYENFLNRLPAFNFVYAAPNPAKFGRAFKVFSGIFGNEDSYGAKHLLRYFEIRRLWETHQTHGLTRVDREILREGDHRFHGQIFEDAYRNWAAEGLSPHALRELLERATEQHCRRFSTFVLPETHAIFQQFSKDRGQKVAGTISQNRSFEVGFSPRLSTVQDKSLGSNH